MMVLTQGPLVRAFPLRFDDSVGRVSGLGSGVFSPTGVDSKCDIFSFVVSVPKGVESKGGRLIGKKLALKFLALVQNFKISF